MVDMQVRAHNEIDFADAEPGTCQAALVSIGIHHVPERTGRSRLVVAHTCVNQDVVLRRLHQVALNTEHDLVLRAHVLRLHPRAVLLEQLLCQDREERQDVEERSLLLHNLVDGDVAQFDRGGMGRFLARGAEAYHRAKCWA